MLNDRYQAARALVAAILLSGMSLILFQAAAVSSRMPPTDEPLIVIARQP